MVDTVTGGDIWYKLAVHKEAGEFSIYFTNGTFGVEGAFAFCFADSPIVFCEVVIIFGVNNGEKALSKRDSVKGIAIAEPAIEEDRQNTEPFKPRWNFNCDGQLNVTPLPMDERRRTIDDGQRFESFDRCSLRHFDEAQCRQAQCNQDKYRNPPPRLRRVKGGQVRNEFE